jgi:hypothetical protein
MKQWIRKLQFVITKMDISELYQKYPQTKASAQRFLDSQSAARRRINLALGESKAKLLNGSGVLAVRISLSRDPLVRCAVATDMRRGFLGFPNLKVIRTRKLEQLFFSVLSDGEGPFISVAVDDALNASALEEFVVEIKNCPPEKLEAAIFTFLLINPVGSVFPLSFLRGDLLAKQKVCELVLQHKTAEQSGDPTGAFKSQRALFLLLANSSREIAITDVVEL